jgi:hypothetical protein
VNNGYQLDLWTDYFVGTAGVGAALAGLVFVALSMHLARIVRTPGVTGRGAQALVLLLSPTLVAIVGLWPADDPARVGIANATVGIALWLAVTGIEYLTLVGGMPSSTGQRVVRVLLGQIATLSVIAAGASFVTGVGFGLDLLILGAISAIVAGLVGAWLLLIEVLRSAS